MAADRVDLGPGVLLPAQSGEPGSAAPQYRRNNRDGFDIVHGCRAAVEPCARRKRRLHARHALLAFEALEERSLLAANVCAGPVVQIQVEIPSRSCGVPPQQPVVVGLVYSNLQQFTLADVLAPDIDVTDMGSHGGPRQEAAFDERVRVVPHDLTVLASPRLRFVRVHDQIMRPVALGPGHEAPFQPGRESGAAPSPQPAVLDLLDNPVPALLHQVAGPVPMAAALGCGKCAFVHAVEIGEYSVPVREHPVTSRACGISARPKAPR